MLEFNENFNKEEFEELERNLGCKVNCDSCKFFVFGRKCNRTGKEEYIDYDLYINPYLCPSFWSSCEKANEFVTEKETRFFTCANFNECYDAMKSTNLEIWMKCRFCKKYETN